MSIYTQARPLAEAFGLQPGQNVLFDHAHPDDETVLTGNAIHRLVRAGVHVYTYTASDGTKSSLGDPHFVRSGRRRGEATRALNYLGVPSEQQHYAGLEDGRLQAARQTMAKHIGSIIRRHDISAIFTAGPAGFDGHDDHSAVHDASMDAAGAEQVPLWALSKEPADVTVAAEPVAKLNAIRWHASQYPGRANSPYITVGSSELVGSERLMAIHGSVEPSLWPYYGLIFFGEHYQLLEPAPPK